MASCATPRSQGPSRAPPSAKPEARALPPRQPVPERPKRVFRPRQPAARFYAEPVDEVPGAEEAAILQVVGRAAASAGVRPPRWEGRLARVARELSGAETGDVPPPSRLVHLCWYHGLVERPPAFVEQQVGSPEPPVADRIDAAHVAEVLAQGQGRYSRVGVGLAGQRVVILLGEDLVLMPPVPRFLAPGDRFEARVRVQPPYRRPGGFLQSPDGEVRRLRRDGRSVHIEFVCGSPTGPYQVEITGEDRLGQHVLANFPVWCAVEPPAEITWEPAGSQPRTVEEAEDVIVALVQRDRRRAGLPELRWDSRLAAISRAHSEDMRDSGFVGHVSPTTGGPTERVRRSRIVTRVLRENVAREYSPEDVQAALLESPGHRENILSPEVTHLGVGVALGQVVGGRRELWVTQMFARFE